MPGAAAGNKLIYCSTQDFLCNLAYTPACVPLKSLYNKHTRCNTAFYTMLLESGSALQNESADFIREECLSEIAIELSEMNMDCIPSQKPTLLIPELI
jgi:hypothetical protein